MSAKAVKTRIFRFAAIDGLGAFPLNHLAKRREFGVAISGHALGCGVKGRQPVAVFNQILPPANRVDRHGGEP